MAPYDDTRPDDPRARAAQTKRDRTRRALLDAAETSFSSRGWAATRVEDVAATAGVSAATAYNHFPTKHALVGHVYGPLLVPLVVQAEQDIARDRPVVEALSDQVMALARIGFRHRTLTAAFWAAVVDYTVRVDGPQGPTDEVDPRTLAPVPNAIRLLVEHGQCRGELRSYPNHMEVASTIVNLLLMRAITRQQETPEETAEVLCCVLFGLVKPELLAEAGRDGRPFH